MKILILGSSGFLGANMFRQLSLAKGVRVVGASRQILRADQRVLQDYSSTSLEKLVEETSPDAVVNCVGVVGHHSTSEDPATAHFANVKVPTNIAAIASRRGIKMVHFSTDSVYSGNPRETPFTEKSSPSPFSLYGEQKLESEQEVRALMPSALILRVNFFGLSVKRDKGILDHFVSHALAGTRPLGYVSYRTSSLDVHSVSVLVRKALEKNLAGTYNLGSLDSLTKFEFGQKVFTMLGRDPAQVIPSYPEIWEAQGVTERDLSMSSKLISDLLEFPLPTQQRGIQAVLQDLVPFLGFFDLQALDPRGTLQRSLVMP